MAVRIAKKKKFFFIIWIYFLSNANLIFEYSILDRIWLDGKVYPSPFLTCSHLLHILPAYHNSKNYFLICQSVFTWWVARLNELHRKSPWFVVDQFIEIKLLFYAVCPSTNFLGWYLFYIPLLSAIHYLELA